MANTEDSELLLEEALDLCHFHDEVTPHLLQGHLEIDYRNACKLFAQLRELKIIANVRLEEDEHGPRQIGQVNKQKLRLSLVN
jgi:hypothetical protein